MSDTKNNPPPGDVSLTINREKCPIRPGHTRKLVTINEPYPKTSTEAYARDDERIAQGLWRSSAGEAFYRVACNSCQACVPLRIDTSVDQPEKHILDDRNRDLWIDEECASPRDDHLKLLFRYYAKRHGGHPLIHSPHDTHRTFDFLLRTALRSSFFLSAYTAGGTLMAATVYDRGQAGWKGRFFYYDPEVPDRRLGKWMTHHLIARARAQGAPYLYLGNVTRQPTRLSWKWTFKGVEVLTNDGWKPERLVKNPSRPDNHFANIAPVPAEE